MGQGMGQCMGPWKKVGGFTGEWAHGGGGGGGGAESQDPPRFWGNPGTQNCPNLGGGGLLDSQPEPASKTVHKA